MRNAIKAVLLATAIGLPAASAVSAMTETDTITMGHSMLVGALVSTLSRDGIDTTGFENLTLEEVVELRTILDNDDTPAATMRSQANRILDEARAR